MVLLIREASPILLVPQFMYIVQVTLYLPLPTSNYNRYCNYKTCQNYQLSLECENKRNGKHTHMENSTCTAYSVLANRNHLWITLNLYAIYLI